jgi:hypothetical protein
MIFPLSINGLSLLASNFSNSLEIIGNREIGLYDFASVGGFPGLGIMITSATFQELGTCFNLKTALYKYLSFIIPFLGSCFKISPVIKSYPGALFELRLVLISFVTSLGVASLISSF